MNVMFLANSSTSTFKRGDEISNKVGDILPSGVRFYTVPRSQDVYILRFLNLNDQHTVTVDASYWI